MPRLDKNRYKVNFYASLPAVKIFNKLHCYWVEHPRHAVDLIERFIDEGYEIRAAYLDIPLLDGTYKNEKIWPLASLRITRLKTPNLGIDGDSKTSF
jgi:hypothetical protein